MSATRTAETADDLDALPVGSVIRCVDESTWVKQHDKDFGQPLVSWYEAGSDDDHSAGWLEEWGYLPAAVLYTPQEADRG